MKESVFQERSLHEQLDESLLSSIINEAYTEVSQDKGFNPNEAFYSRWCEPVTDAIVKKLRQKEIKAQSLLCNSGWNVLEHYFVLIDSQGESMILDATWQQFLKDPDPTKPKFFYVTAGHLKEQLTELGIPSGLHYIWLNTIPKNQYYK